MVQLMKSTFNRNLDSPQFFFNCHAFLCFLWSGCLTARVSTATLITLDGQGALPKTDRIKM
jgi:hypothetical protein